MRLTHALCVHRTGSRLVHAILSFSRVASALDRCAHSPLVHAFRISLRILVGSFTCTALSFHASPFCLSFASAFSGSHWIVTHTHGSRAHLWLHHTSLAFSFGCVSFCALAIVCDRIVRFAWIASFSFSHWISLPLVRLRLFFRIVHLFPHRFGCAVTRTVTLMDRSFAHTSVTHCLHTCTRSYTTVTHLVLDAHARTPHRSWLLFTLTYLTARHGCTLSRTHTFSRVCRIKLTSFCTLRFALTRILPHTAFCALVS